MSDSGNPGDSREQRVDAVIADYLQHVEAGRTPHREELLMRHPELARDLQSFFADHDRMRRAAGRQGAPTPGPPDVPTVSPNEGAPTMGETASSFGDYEIMSEIARGGMGVVYKARQLSLNRIVALKMILSGQF